MEYVDHHLLDRVEARIETKFGACVLVQRLSRIAPTYIGGGALRDAMFGSGGFNDVDIIFDGANDDLVDALKAHDDTEERGYDSMTYRSRAGGFDVWCCADTSPTILKGAAPTIENIASSFMLNIDRAVIELRTARVIDRGMRAAFIDKVIELENPWSGSNNVSDRLRKMHARYPAFALGPKARAHLAAKEQG